MTITWHGLYAVKITTGDTTVVIDPHPKKGSHQATRGKASIVTLSNPSDPEMAYLDGIQGEPLLINTPGEYSVEGLTLYATGWHGKDGAERSFLRWHIENMVAVHLGALDRELTAEELQELEQTNVDILFLPIGTKDTFLKTALSMLTTIEPRVVIPMNYDSPAAFAKEMGVSARSAEPRLTTSRRKLPDEGLETVILSA